MSSIISKSQASVYRMRKDGEYACIVIEAWERPVSTSTDPQGVAYAGELLINSSFGNFCNQWGHCGVPFEQFLLSLGKHSFLEKCLGENAEEFDHDGSLQAIKRRVLEARRAKDLSKDEARDIYDMVSGLYQHQDEGGFTQAILAFDHTDTSRAC